MPHADADFMNTMIKTTPMMMSLVLLSLSADKWIISLSQQISNSAK